MPEDIQIHSTWFLGEVKQAYLDGFLRGFKAAFLRFPPCFWLSSRRQSSLSLKEKDGQLAVSEEASIYVLPVFNSEGHGKNEFLVP